MKQLSEIILASASPRRQELLCYLGVTFRVVASDLAEVGYGGMPQNIAQRIAMQKAKSVKAQLGPGFSGSILAADTLVVVDTEVLGKPQDQEHAKSMLRKLSGKEHTVITGFYLESADGDKVSQAVETQVCFDVLNDQIIEDYVDTGEPMDKAGAYAIQGRGGALVRSIQGSYTNVVGLPLCEVRAALLHLGVVEA